MYPRGVGRCPQISSLDQDLHANQIVFSFQIPFAKENVILDFSRWQQNLIGILQLEIQYSKETPVREWKLILSNFSWCSYLNDLICFRTSRPVDAGHEVILPKQMG